MIAIIGTLVGLLLPAVQAAREAARRTQCQNNLRQVGIGFSSYESTHSQFPIGCVGCKFVPGQSQQDRLYTSWNLRLLSFLEQEQVVRLYHDTKPYSHVDNQQAVSTIIPTFLCPSATGESLPPEQAAPTDYGGMSGIEGKSEWDAPVGDKYLRQPEALGALTYEWPTKAAEITDGLAHTVIAAECVRRTTEVEYRGNTHTVSYETQWANGHNLIAQHYKNRINQTPDNEIYSPHPETAGVVFCDGHVQFINESIEQSVLLAILTRAGGEVVNED